MNRLARDLDVQPPSLYNHVNSLRAVRHELAILNADNLGRCFSEAAIGKAGPSAIESVAQAYRTYITGNAGLYFSSLRASGSSPDSDPALREAEERVVGVVLAILAPFELNEEDAIHATRGLRALVHGFASLEAAGGFGLSIDCDESFRRLVRAYIYALEQKRLTGGAGE